MGEMKMNSKKPWQSKTMLLNGIGGLLLFAAMFIPAAAGGQAFINAHATEIGLFWSIANMVLRAITKDKIGLTE